MKRTKRMRAVSAIGKLMQHVTTQMILVRNIFEDGDPDGKMFGEGNLSVSDLKGAAGEQTMALFERAGDLLIDDESESERVKQRKAERDAKSGRKPEPPTPDKSQRKKRA